MMFDRYTVRARKVIGLARQEAGRLNHQYIGTEHLLLGLVLEGSGTACNVLRNLAIDLDEVVARVEKIVQPGPTMATALGGSLPFTPRTKRALEIAAEEGTNLRHNYIGTEHLLIALVREGEGVAAQVLLSFATAEHIREETLELLGEPAAGMPLSFDRLRAANVKRCEEVFHPVKAWSPTDWATALAGEVGEACNEIKKLRRLDGADAVLDTLQEREAIRVRVGRELADVIAYADLLAARMGIDLGAAVIAKFNEVSKKRNSTVYL